MGFNVVMEESDFKSNLNYDAFMEKMLRDIDNACEKFIQEYADKYQLSFRCAEKVLQKYYDINIGIDITDNKCYITFASQLKPIEEILNDVSIDLTVDCERELWGK